MTRSFFFSLLLLASFSALLSQPLQGDLRFGFQLSPTFSSMNTNDNLINGDGTNLGLKLGLMTEFYFRENYSFSTGLNFHLNGGGTLFYENTFDEVDIWNDGIEGVSDTSFSGGASFKYNLQFVEIPIALTLRTREFGYMRYFVRPAFNIGVVTQARGNVKNVSYVNAEEDFDIASAVNGVNLSWGLSAGVEYSISSNTALVGGIGFQSGFADLTKDKNTTVTRGGRSPSEDNSRGKMTSIILTLGVLF